MAQLREGVLLVVSMVLPIAILFGPGAIVPAIQSHEYFRDGGLVLLGEVLAVVGLATAVAALIYLPHRRRIVGQTFPFLKPGYVFVAAPGAPALLAFLPSDVQGFPLVQLAGLSIFYEVNVLIGALIFVALLRWFGLFAPEEWPTGKGPPVKATSVR